MARARAQASTGKAASRGKRAGTAGASEASAGSTSAEFTCPECGRTFGRAAALGAHRRRAHGVAGQSAQAKRSRSRQQSAKSTRGGARAATTGRSASRTTGAKQARGSTQSAARSNGVDRDALLKSIFPAGVPAREEVIRAATGWLDDAERLAQMR